MILLPYVKRNRSLLKILVCQILVDEMLLQEDLAIGVCVNVNKVSSVIHSPNVNESVNTIKIVLLLLLAKTTSASILVLEDFVALMPSVMSKITTPFVRASMDILEILSPDVILVSYCLVA